MYGNWRDRANVPNSTPRGDVAVSEPQRCGESQASSALRSNDLLPVGPQMHGSPQTPWKPQSKNGAQLRAPHRCGPQISGKTQSNCGGQVMGNFRADVVSLMNSAQQARQPRNVPIRGGPPAPKDHYPQCQDMGRTNPYAPARGSALHPDISGRPRGQTNAFMPSGKPQRQIMQKSMYELGVVIRAPHHEEDRDGGSGESFRGPDSAEQMARTLTKTVTGEWLFTKHRKFIVVALHKNNYHALPLYTHNGNGLKSNNLDPDEWVSVQDHRADPVEALSRHKTIRTEKLEDHVRLFHPKSAANIAYGVPRPYNLPVVYEGRLSDDSRDYLLHLYQDRTHRGSSLRRAK